MRAPLTLTLAISFVLSWGVPAQAREADRATAFSAKEVLTLKQLESQGIDYFLDNQLANGLVQDRQTNFVKKDPNYQCSLSATGMGLIAIALASGPHFKKVSRADAIERVSRALIAAKKLPEIHGMMPHFFDPVTLKWKSPDQVSTIDSSWLIAGGLWAAAYLKDEQLQKLADELYDRVDWSYWADTDTTSGAPVLSMGMGEDNKRFKSQWDRINSEAAFMYVLAIGAKEHALAPTAWKALKPFIVKVGEEELAGGDLGLFSFQYSDDLMDLNAYHGNQIDLHAQSIRAARANYEACKSKADQYKTFKKFWGLSAGDGPPNPGQNADAYRAYAPATDVDGTAHVMASLASIDVAPKLVLQNIDNAERLTSPKMHGRYGYSNINLDKNWVSKDVVGIDVGIAVMALDNQLWHNEVRDVWQSLPGSIRAAERLNTVVQKSAENARN